MNAISERERKKTLFLIHGLLIGFMVGLVISGATAFPLPPEVALLAHMMGIRDGVDPAQYSGMTGWIAQVHQALDDTYRRFPLLFYGTDWLAFGHIVIATAFIGPYRDPVRNVWVLHWAAIACVLVIPLALICGPLRGIPVYWRLIDCSFGVVGIIPIYICLRLIKKLEPSA